MSDPINPSDNLGQNPATPATAQSSAYPLGGASATAPEGEALDNDAVVDVLNDLLENCRDGEYGFRACAEEVDSAQLRGVFEKRAAECQQAGAELMPLIAQYGGKADEGGSASGALHRGWVHVKGSVGADSAESMLNECERGEDSALAEYRKALKQNLPADVRTVVERQAQGAQQNHDQIKMLRDQARSS